MFQKYYFLPFVFCFITGTFTSCTRTISNCDGNGAFSEEKKRPIGYRCVEIGEKIDSNKFRMPCAIMKWDPSDYFTDPKHIEMCNAIEYEEYEKIESLLHSGVDINAHGKGNMSFLFWGLPNGVKMFEFLLKNGADPNIQFSQDIIPRDLLLHGSAAACATFLGESYVKLLLEYGCDPNLENLDNKRSLIFYAGWIGDFLKQKTTVELLIQHGADINHRDVDGKTPLMRSIPFAIILYLELDADYRIPDNLGKTILESIVFLSENLKDSPTQYENIVKPLVSFFKQKEDIDISLDGDAYLKLKSIILDGKTSTQPSEIKRIMQERKQLLEEYYLERWGDSYAKWLSSDNTAPSQ